MLHHATIRGIPCIVEATFHEAHRGAREHGSGIQLEPDEPAYWEIEQVFDRTGRPAPWLERKLDEADRERILDEIAQLDLRPDEGV